MDTNLSMPRARFQPQIVLLSLAVILLGARMLGVHASGRGPDRVLVAQAA